MKCLIIAIVASMAILMHSDASAVTAEQKAVLDKVEAYLESITTIKADFVQIAPGGELTSGQFLLKRPGKMRWAYDPPVPVLMVASGGNLRYYDYELDQISDIPLDESLAGFLTQDDIRFDPEVITVKQAHASNGVLRVKVVQTSKPDDGELTMEFSEVPLKLRNLILVDSQGKQTNVSLNNAAYGVAVADDMFVIKDNRLSGKQRR